MDKLHGIVNDHIEENIERPLCEFRYVIDALAILSASMLMAYFKDEFDEGMKDFIKMVSELRPLKDKLPEAGKDESL